MFTGASGLPRSRLPRRKLNTQKSTRKLSVQRQIPSHILGCLSKRMPCKKSQKNKCPFHVLFHETKRKGLDHENSRMYFYFSVDYFSGILYQLLTLHSEMQRNISISDDKIFLWPKLLENLIPSGNISPNLLCSGSI